MKTVEYVLQLEVAVPKKPRTQVSPTPLPKKLLVFLASFPNRVWISISHPTNTGWTKSVRIQSPSPQQPASYFSGRIFVTRRFFGHSEL